MTQYVAILSVGPVQGFISAARRSRDLWSGSWLLSELAKACAHSLADQGAELIFPTVQSISELNKNTELSVGNKIQVIIKAETVDALKQQLEQAKAATVARFVEEAQSAQALLKHAQQDLRLNIWQHQLEDYVEVQCAWAKIDEAHPQGYKQAAELAAQVLASRKATRDFKASAVDAYDSDFMLPKSSLDGARETVLKENTAIKNLTRTQLSLSPSEQLDCAGIIKRLGLKEVAEQFTPYTRVAAHAWVEQLAQDDRLQQIKELYEQLVALDVATRVKGNQGVYKEFAFDAQYLYASRLDAAIQQYQYDAEIVPVLNDLKKALIPLWKQYGHPYTYGVMLLADGDRMGELLDQATTLAQHQSITTALSKFAVSVPALMRQYHAHCIYSGGDDVLGFVPLHQAYDCAKALSIAFHDALKEIAIVLNVAQAPTLSVGLAVCHVNTPLGVIRELASKAEKYAKGDHCADMAERRNALGITLSVRSGTDTSLRLRWDDTRGHDTFRTWVNLYVNKQVPTRIAYDTRSIDLSTQHISSDQVLLTKIRSAEYTRMLKKARLVSGQRVSDESITALKQRGETIGFKKLAEELIVARWFAAKLQNDLGKE